MSTRRATGGLRTRQVPTYDRLQSAFHHAFRAELTSILEKLRVPAGGKVLDVPCGDGFYSELFLRRLPATTELLALDASPAYLERARARIEDDPRCRVLEGTVYQLPFEEGTIDLVWCAYSLISLEDRARALREMVRVLAPGGVLAILETDEYHHVLLPWPVGLELEVQRVLYEVAGGTKLAPVRKLREQLRESGFTSIRKKTISMERASPFEFQTQRFLKEHFKWLRKKVRPRLGGRYLRRFDQLIGTAKTSFLHRADSELTCLTTLYLSRKGQQ